MSSWFLSFRNNWLVIKARDLDKFNKFVRSPFEVNNMMPSHFCEQTRMLIKQNVNNDVGKESLKVLL